MRLKLNLLWICFYGNPVVTIYSSFCSVSENMPLYDILNEFQKGHSHIAVVYRDLNDKKGTYKKIKDSEQLEFQDSCKNKGKSAPLDKGRDLNISINNKPCVGGMFLKVWLGVC